MPLSREETPQVEQAADASGKTAGNTGQLSPSVSPVEKAWKRLNGFRALLRLTPFDVSTEAGRSKERYRRAMLTSLASGVARGAAVLTVLISVPLTVRYLGSERFGLWMTISSFTALLQFADLGMGNGLLNAISDANGRGDVVAARKYVANGFYLLSGIAAILLGAFVVAYPLIPWPRVFNVTSALAMKEAGPATAAFVVCLALNLPLGVVQRVQLGYQEGFASYLWQAAGSLFGLAGVLLVIYLRGGLTWLVLAMSGGTLLALLLNSVFEFCWSKRWLFPKWSCFETAATRKILGTGFLFVILQLACAVAFASDNIVAARILGPEAVTQYSVPARLFSFLGTVAALFFMPLWPAYGEAVARGEWAWVRRTLVRSLGTTLLICGIPAICMVFLGRTIIRLWVGSLIQPSFLLLLGMGTSAVLGGLGGAAAMFLNGANILRFQVVSAVLMATSALVAKILLGRAVGLPGIIWGGVVAYFVCTAVPFAVYIPRLLKKMNQSMNPMRINDQCR